MTKGFIFLYKNSDVVSSFLKDIGSPLTGLK